MHTTEPGTIRCNVQVEGKPSSILSHANFSHPPKSNYRARKFWCDVQVEGIFSGTLSYIFNGLVAGTNFSDIVTQAKDAGFTEPDPRDDLAGMDVARKVTILARYSTPSPPPSSHPSSPNLNEDYLHTVSLQVLALPGHQSAHITGTFHLPPAPHPPPTPLAVIAAF